MARKTGSTTMEMATMTPIERASLVKTMLELVQRGPHETSLMVRCANAGGLKEVVDHVKKMRVMFKRFTGGREPHTTAPKPTPRKKAHKRRQRTEDAAGDSN